MTPKTEDGYRYVRQMWRDGKRVGIALWERKGGRMRRVGTARTPGEVDAFLGMPERKAGVFYDETPGGLEAAMTADPRPMRKAPEPCSCEELIVLRKERDALYVERNRLETRLAFIEGQHKLLVTHVADEAIKEARRRQFEL